jgi:biopolymer transport protein ExbB
MGSWYVAITNTVDQYRVMRQAQAANATFWTAGSIRAGAQGLPARSPFRFIAESALQATETHERLLDRIDLHTWVTMSIQQSVDTVQTRLARWPDVPRDGGIDRAVHRVVRHRLGHLSCADRNRRRRPGVDRQGRRARGRSPDHDGARPGRRGAAVFAYNWLVRRNKLVMEKVRTFSATLHSMLMAALATRRRSTEDERWPWPWVFRPRRRGTR